MEVSSTSSTRHRRLRRCSATSPDQALTSAFTDGQLTPWRRTTARIVITCASATRRCARRRVSRPSNSGCSSSHRLSQPPHTNRRRIHTSVVRRPDTSRSRTERSRVSCTLWHLNPQCGQRGRLTSTRPAPATRSACPQPPRARGSGAGVQTHPHNIGSHRGPPGSLMMSITDSSRAPTPQRGPSTTPLPTFTRRLKIEEWVEPLLWQDPRRSLPRQVEGVGVRGFGPDGAPSSGGGEEELRGGSAAGVSAVDC